MLNKHILGTAGSNKMNEKKKGNEGAQFSLTTTIWSQQIVKPIYHSYNSIKTTNNFPCAFLGFIISWLHMVGSNTAAQYKMNCDPHYGWVVDVQSVPGEVSWQGVWLFSYLFKRFTGLNWLIDIIGT